MKKVILYEPSIGSDNLGDQIIVDGIKSALKNYLSDSFTIELPTHTPINWRYFQYLEKVPADMKLVCGSNIIVGKLNSFVHLRQWSIPIMSMYLMGPLVFVGVGVQQYNQKINAYTKMAYKKMMKENFFHSVRDSYTEQVLKNIGINNVVNTGCPTIWGLTEEVCSKIPIEKASSCVVTLTDYKPDSDRDNKLLLTLKKCHDDVYFWPQGNGDWKYFLNLEQHKEIKIIQPNLVDYSTFLENNKTDFIGTRLHGGIRAMQKGCRTIIIGVDNRAIELNNDFNIPVLPQNRIEELEMTINSKFTTKINLPQENISMFLKQFEKRRI